MVELPAGTVLPLAPLGARAIPSGEFVTPIVLPAPQSHSVRLPRTFFTNLRSFWKTSPFPRRRFIQEPSVARKPRNRTLHFAAGRTRPPQPSTSDHQPELQVLPSFSPEPRLDVLIPAISIPSASLRNASPTLRSAFPGVRSASKARATRSSHCAARPTPAQRVPGTAQRVQETAQPVPRSHGASKVRTERPIPARRVPAVPFRFRDSAEGVQGIIFASHFSPSSTVVHLSTPLPHGLQEASHCRIQQENGPQTIRPPTWSGFTSAPGARRYAPPLVSLPMA